MTKHLGLFKGPYSLPDIDLYVKIAIDQNVSILAMDADDNTVLGVMVNGVAYKDDMETDLAEVIGRLLDPKFAPISAALHEVQRRAHHIYQEFDTDSLFDMKIVACSAASRGMGLATDLMQRSVDLAQVLGFKGAKGEATGIYSAKA